MGSSIPLPALDLKPPAPQPNPMEQYGNLLQLKNMVQEQPVRQQILQQQQQSGQLGVQQQQLQLKDQQAMTAAMQQWDGKDVNQLIPLVIKNGASATAVMGLKSKVLEQQQAYSTIAKNDADAGTANMGTMIKKNDLVSGALSPLIDPQQTPDAQLSQAVLSTAQDLQQKGLLDPQHMQAAQHIVQSGNPDQIRQQLSIMQKGLMGQSAQMDMAQKQAAIASDQSTTAKNQAESQYYNQNGGAPGVPAEMMQQADWLKKNPTKGPSDFLLWKLQHTPFAMVMGNQLGGAQNSQALDFVANNYRQTGQMPPELTRSPGTITAVIQRAAQLDAQNGGSGIASNKTTLAADADSLKFLQKNYDNVTAFENTAGKNLDQFLSTAKSVVDSGSPLLNTPLRNISDKMAGSDKIAAFNAARVVGLTEIAKVLNSSNASGVLSDSAREEVEQLITPNATLKQIYAAAGILKQDMSNRQTSYQKQITDIQTRIKNGGGQQQQPSAGGAGMVTVQIPGSPAGQIPASGLQKFKADHPNAQVSQ